MNNLDIKVGDKVKIINKDKWYLVTDIFSSEVRIMETLNDVRTAYIDYVFFEDIIEVRRPTKYKTIYKKSEPILDDKEKEYLSNVIKPFRDGIKYICKCSPFLNPNAEYIYMILKNEKEFNIYFPNFKKGTMYKNMEADKGYTLEELGL